MYTKDQNYELKEELEYNLSYAKVELLKAQKAYDEFFAFAHNNVYDSLEAARCDIRPKLLEKLRKDEFDCNAKDEYRQAFIMRSGQEYEAILSSNFTDAGDVHYPTSFNIVRVY